MTNLTPDLGMLQREYVLVQAFKKTVSYIRSHNWFADVLELDLATVDYPSFLEELKHDIERAARWKNQKARLVPAPKSREWWITGANAWEPRPDDDGQTDAELRPLAHISLRDQVVATAIMMCLADRIETRQGDPQLDIRNRENRKRVVSYGNRLFCDAVEGHDGKPQLRHRWGSSKLYRSYFADYRTFIARPDIVAAEIGERSRTKTVVVESDLSQFYDRVRPALLHAKLKSHVGDNTVFLKFAKRVLKWRWDDDDKGPASDLTDISSFTSLALPQGLVSSGFFANLVLLDFDDEMRSAFDTPLAEGVVLRDATRYVDDLRFVVEVSRDTSMRTVETVCHDWIQHILGETATGLVANKKKTRAVPVHDSQRVMVFQSRRMRRIQESVSGGVDAHGGTQLLAALEALFNTIGRFLKADENERWPVKSVPDVRDETVARFVAARYRTTFRSLRPLLEDEFVPPRELDAGNDDETLEVTSSILTKEELDRQCQAFGLRLIEEWICNPGNVRLLRVGLDLYPDSTVLESVLGLLKPIIASRSNDPGIRQIAEYCLSEVFRAAATETGLVPDPELLPSDIDLEEYQDVLRDYARELMADQWNSLPWFCKQQILLFLATSSPVGIDSQAAGNTKETEEYGAQLAFLQGQPEDNLDRWSVRAVLARQSFLDTDSATRLLVPQLTKERISRLATLAPNVAEELLLNNRRLRRLAGKSVLNLLSLPQLQPKTSTSEPELPLVSEARRWNCRLRDESRLLRFSLDWLRQRARNRRSLPPASIQVLFGDDEHPTLAFGKKIPTALFEAPSWCESREKWRFVLGLVLRFIITGQSDPTQIIRYPSWREQENCYRPPPWHWEVRRYSLYNGREKLGPDWIPISSWMESFLTALLHWPGALEPPQPFRDLHTVSRAEQLCRDRLEELESMRGEATGLLMLPITPRTVPTEIKPLRICIAQLAVPEFKDGRAASTFGPHDPEFNAPETRQRYRRHLTAMLAGVDQMLRARATHREGTGLDLLILPELGVHPDDVRSRLLPFVRKHACWVFTGLTYHRCHADGPLVNSGLWIVPESSPSGGILFRLYEQGKQHLAPEEARLLAGMVEGHRPCQWLLRWVWSSSKSDRDLILSGSICYDATDLSLVADLKKRSDIYLIPALNRDVGTFDKMTDALHYHMYQMVILANHAHFGGSNAYVPYRQQFYKQVFHLHGQDEAIVAFLDIDNASELINRGCPEEQTPSTGIWKTPPADWTPPTE